MSEERLKLERETANEALIPAPRDYTYPRHHPPTRGAMKMWFALHVPLWDFDEWYDAQQKEKSE